MNDVGFSLFLVRSSEWDYELFSYHAASMA